MLTRETTMPKRAYPYSRHSTHDQRDGDSRRRQDEPAPRLAAKHGWLIDTSLSLYDDGLSAYHKHNITKGALGRFIDAVATGRVSAGSVLIIENWDRFSRAELTYVLPVFLNLINNGIVIAHTSPEKIISKDTINSDFTLLEAIIAMKLANAESVRKSDMISKEWAQRRKTRKPRGWTCPAWLRPRSDGSGYELIPEYAATIRQIHQWAQAGLGAHRIRQQLQADPERYPPPSRINAKGRCVGPRRWTTPYVQQLLKSRRVFGVYEPGQRVEGKKHPTGERIDNYYPAVITEADWERTQAAIAHRNHYRPGRPSPAELNLFTGLVFNADTGHPLSLNSNSRASYLASYSYEKSSPTIRYSLFEPPVRQMIKGLRIQDVLPPSAVVEERDHEIHTLGLDCEAIRNKMKGLDDILADPAQPPENDPPTLEARRKLAALLDAKTRRRDQLKIESANTETDNLTEAQAAIEQLESPQDRRRARSAIARLVESIWVRIEPVTRSRRYIHIQVFLRSREKLYLVIEPARPTAVPPSLWGDLDFREGHIRDGATNPDIPPKLAH